MGTLVFTLGASELDSVPALPTGPGDSLASTQAGTVAAA